MTAPTPEVPLLSWAELDVAMTACADHFEAAAVAYSEGDLGMARARLDQGRGARAHLFMLQQQFRRERPSTEREMKHAVAVKHQTQRFRAAEEAVRLLLEHFHRHRTPSDPPTDDDIQHTIDVELPDVWDLHQDLVLIPGTASVNYAKQLARRGFKRIMLLLDSPEDTVEDLPSAIHVAKSLKDARVYGRSLLNPPPGRLCLVGAPDDLDAEAQDAIRQEVMNGLQSAAQYVQTLSHFGERLATQTVLNLPRLLVLPTFDQLELDFASIPALIVCPGPSLGDALDTVAGLQGKAILIAVSHALHPLLDRGIVPDIVVSIDPGPGSLTQFQGVDLSDIPLGVLGVSMVTELMRLPTLERVATISCNGVAELWVSDLHGAVSPVAAGGTVAHAAAVLAMRMGCKNIGFIGQDLAYRGTQMYAAGTAAAVEISQDASNQTVNEGGVQRIRVEVPGWDGEMLVTSQNFNSYRLWYERLVAENEHIRFVNGSVGGARIAGMEHMPLDVWSEGWTETHPIAETLRAAYTGALPEGDRKARNARAMKSIKSRVRLIEDVAKQTNKGHRLNERFARGEPVGAEVTKARKKLVKRVKDVPEVGVYIDRQLSRIMNLGKGKLSHHIVVETYRDLFQALGRATRELKGSYAQAVAELKRS